MKLISLCAALGMLVACSADPVPEPVLSLTQVLGGSEVPESGYLRATSPRSFRFPEDHGPHRGFRNEWWYLTGNLDTAEGRHFGYQLTFFNAALPESPASGASAWESDTLWMAHFALTDAQTGQHRPAERFSRGAPGLAGASAEPFRVWLDNWQFTRNTETGLWHVQVEDGDLALDLSLDALKRPVLQGESGLSQKSPQPGNASYYYSMTRLATEGTIRSGQQQFQVSGLSWLDREWSTSALGADQGGWNWFALQFLDGQELMYYQMVDLRGEPLSSSAGSWTDVSAVQHPIAPGQIVLEPLRTWTSPADVAYPVEWKVRYGQQDWRVKALVDAQWMNLSIPYWEGAVEVRDWATGALAGHGYLEVVRESRTQTNRAP